MPNLKQEELLNYLTKYSIVKNISKGIAFNDEPDFYYYLAEINKNLQHLKKVTTEINAGGASFKSAESALQKCLSETVERYSLFSMKENGVKNTYLEIIDSEKNALNPEEISGIKNSQSKKFQWVEGNNLTKGIKSYIPEQLINLNYKNRINEINLSPVISTGASANYSEEEAILGGIYEVIERDSYMSSYLTQIIPPLINIETINDNQIKKILYSCLRYKLKPYVFDLTNDLNIPVFLTLLTDKTGIGPAVTIGVKCDLDPLNAIIGSIEESFMSRTWVRFNMLGLKKTKIYNNRITDSRLKRALLWSSLSIFKRLNSIINQNSNNLILDSEKKELNVKEKINYLIKSLAKKNFQIFTKRIFTGTLLDKHLTVCKVIIPPLQPLYLFKPFINLKRLKQVSLFFGQPKLAINNFPHPFL